MSNVDPPSSPPPGLDFGPFDEIFFEEAGETLDRMEQALLDLDAGGDDDETLNSIFRCAHSIKGGAAALGLADVAELTHHMETLLHLLRRHQLAATPVVVDVLLEGSGALRDRLARRRSAPATPAIDIVSLVERIGHLADSCAGATPASTQPARSARELELRLGPLVSDSIVADVVDLFREVAGLGVLTPLGSGEAAVRHRRFLLCTHSDDDALLDLMSLHVGRDQVELVSRPRPAGMRRSAPDAPPPDAPASEAATLRVSVVRAEQLAARVEELAAIRSMLAQVASSLERPVSARFAAGLAALDRSTRALQESVLSIRTMPMAVVFNRFPRMLRDLAARLGKQVELVTEGDAIEVDSSVVEKITDALTHLVRNACDHGIEPPRERHAAGKPATGTVRLAASLEGGSIVIEVGDDGRGLARGKLIATARERGIEIDDAAPDAAVWTLIFTPGLSTVDAVTDVSGRGVGMDVVRRNVADLGGTIEVDSTPGRGLRVRVRVPLALALVDDGAPDVVRPACS